MLPWGPGAHNILGEVIGTLQLAAEVTLGHRVGVGGGGGTGCFQGSQQDRQKRALSGRQGGGAHKAFL